MCILLLSSVALYGAYSFIYYDFNIINYTGVPLKAELMFPNNLKHTWSIYRLIVTESQMQQSQVFQSEYCFQNDQAVSLAIGFKEVKEP